MQHTQKTQHDQTPITPTIHLPALFIHHVITTTLPQKIKHWRSQKPLCASTCFSTGCGLGFGLACNYAAVLGEG